MMRQKAKIKVSEEGSDAAAVTVAGANYESGSATPPEFPKATFHANRSFVYVIREVSSGIILFVGKFTGQ
jgi:serpin B